MSPKAPCKESAQTQKHTSEKPTLEETHIGLGHSEISSPMTIDEPQLTYVTQPPFIYEILSSTCPTSLVFSLTSRAENRPNLLDVDLPFQTMEEPSSSGPQKPIAQSIMDTTPPNNEFNQGRIQSENEKATTLVTLPSTTFSIKVAVTTSVAVNDSAGTTAPLVVESIPAVRTSLAVTSTPAGKAYTVVFTQTDNIVSTQYVVTQMQHPSIVLVEDDSDDDNVLI